MTIIAQWTHGAAAYNYRGCRCNRCRAGRAEQVRAQAQAQRQYRASLRERTPA